MKTCKAAVLGKNANDEMPTPKTPIQKYSPQTPNAKVIDMSCIGVLFVAFRPDTVTWRNDKYSAFYAIDSKPNKNQKKINMC